MEQYINRLLDKIEELNFDLLHEKRQSNKLKKENRTLRKEIKKYKNEQASARNSFYKRRPKHETRIYR